MNQIHKTSKRYVIIGLLIGGALSFFSTFSYGTTAEKDIPLKISKETTLITEPLKSNEKEVDYFRALELLCYPPNMKTDENGYRMITRTLGPAVNKNAPEWIMRQTYEKLGLDPTLKPTMTFQSINDYLAEYAKTNPDISKMPEEEQKKWVEQHLEKLKRPWTAKDAPLMATWLETNSKAIDLIAKAVRQPNYCIPQVREKESQTLMENLRYWSSQQHSHYARALYARANHRIATGNMDGAIDDMLACKALGRNITQQGFAIDLLVGISIEKMLEHSGIAGTLERQPTETQLQRLLDTLLDASGKSMPKRKSFEESWLLEQYFCIDVIQKTASLDPHERSKFLKEKCYMPFAMKLGFFIDHSTFDWNIVAEEINDAYKNPESRPIFNPREMEPNELHSLKKRSQFFAELFLNTSGPRSLRCVQYACHRAECYDRLQAITLAMLIYEKQHGHLPPAWTVDGQGKPLQSWRVLLLPYLGKEAKKLYEKIRLDEPWDSEHNRQFHATAIPFYQCPGAELTPGKTAYTVVLGAKTAFRDTGQGVKLDELGPNSANLLLVTERKTPICWMNPTDEVTETDAQTQIGSKHVGAICCGFRGGHVVVVPADLFPDPQTRNVTQKYSPDIFPKLLEGTAAAIPSL